MHSLPLTLAAWDDYIWLMLVGATVIGSWISNMKKKGEAQRKRDEGPASMEPQEPATRRREQLRQASRGRAQTPQPGGQPTGFSGGNVGLNAGGGAGGGGEPGNLTMAERIARARAKAQYQQRNQGAVQAPPRTQAQVPNAAQRRALQQRQDELQRRQQAAQAQARQQAQQQRAQAQARQRGTRSYDPAPGPTPTRTTTRQSVPGTSTPNRPTIQTVTRPAPSSLLTSSSLSRDDLRRAIVLNEVLGKPVALRDQAASGF